MIMLINCTCDLVGQANSRAFMNDMAKTKELAFAATGLLEENKLRKNQGRKKST